MKKLLLLVLLIGCQNRKEEITGKQKVLQERIIYMTLKANQFDHKAAIFISHKNQALTTGQMDTLNTLRDSARQYENNVAGLRRELDSLERELKK